MKKINIDTMRDLGFGVQSSYPSGLEDVAKTVLQRISSGLESIKEGES